MEVTDRIRVLKGLHEAECLLEDRVPARYRGYALQAVKDAAELLKAQEPVEPHYKELAILGQWDSVPICGACGTIIGYSVKYCPHCGREVQWNAEEGHD